MQDNETQSPISTTEDNSSVEYFSETQLPTEFGTFRVSVFCELETGKEHLAISQGDVEGRSDLLVRVHSECFTGEILHSLKCDCREQLHASLQMIDEAGLGMVIYHRQEGRNIGLGNKIKAYALQEAGYDTVDANTMLGFGADQRTYNAPADILKHFGIKSVRLVTNNPAKIERLRAEGIVITDRVPLLCQPNDVNIDYFRTKQERMRHMFEESQLNNVHHIHPPSTATQHNGWNTNGSGTAKKNGTAA